MEIVKSIYDLAVREECLAPQVQQELLRIAQEAISNALRHAKPTVIDVSFRSRAPNLVLEVRDNGYKKNNPEMKSPLHILHLEDDVMDAELVQETLLADGIECEITRVETEAGFLAALEQGGFDLVFADFSLPSFDGFSALKVVQRKCPDLPVIFVSGTMVEELPVEALKLGGTDYVLKARLLRIVPSVKRAVREAEERAELAMAQEALRRSEAYLGEAQKLSRTGSFGWEISSGKIYWSEETFRIFECDPATEPTLELIEPADSSERQGPDPASNRQRFT